MGVHLACIRAVGRHLIRPVIVHAVEVDVLLQEPVHHLRLLAPFAACPNDDVVPLGAQGVDLLSRIRQGAADPRPLAIVDRPVKVYCDDHGRGSPFSLNSLFRILTNSSYATQRYVSTMSISSS